MGRTQGVSFSETPCSASKRHIRFYSVPVGLTQRSISFRIELTVNVNTLFHGDQSVISNQQSINHCYGAKIDRNNETAKLLKENMKMRRSEGVY